MVGDAHALTWATSLKLGVGRLTADLVRGDPPQRRRPPADRSTPSPPAVDGRVLPDIVRLGPRVAVGSSGTLETLIALAGCVVPGRSPRPPLMTVTARAARRRQPGSPPHDFQSEPPCPASTPAGPTGHPPAPCWR